MKNLERNKIIEAILRQRVDRENHFQETVPKHQDAVLKRLLFYS